MRLVRITLVIAAAAWLSAFALSTGGASAAAAPQVTLLECDKHPAQFDVIYITNSGDAALDLAGWTLRSDPEASEQMSLAVAGALDAGEQMIVVAGAHGVTIPSENVWLWTNAEILRDSGDPADYVKLYDASGGFVSGLDCSGQVLTAAPPPAAAPTAAPQSAGENPGSTQPTQQQATAGPSAGPKAVPNSGGPAGDRGAGWWLIVGALAVIGGAFLIIESIRGDAAAARITATEGDSRACARGAARRSRRRD